MRKEIRHQHQANAMQVGMTKGVRCTCIRTINKGSTWLAKCRGSDDERIRCPVLLGEELLERRLVDHDVPHRLEPLPAFFLPVQQLPPARYVARVELRQYVLPERLEGFSGDDSTTDCGLDDHLCEPLVTLLSTTHDCFRLGGQL